jgi:hypothetical protein
MIIKYIATQSISPEIVNASERSKAIQFQYSPVTPGHSIFEDILPSTFEHHHQK